MTWIGGIFRAILFRVILLGLILRLIFILWQLI
jgi:hypothetical protein